MRKWLILYRIEISPGSGPAILLVCLLLALISSCLKSGSLDENNKKNPEIVNSPSNDVLTSTERTLWWQDAKYGMFIHWGLYSRLAGQWHGLLTSGLGEWIMQDLNIPLADYESASTEFNPVRFDALAWVNVAKLAGMKYIVITAKHHDGFSMFDSHVSKYNIVQATSYRQDPMALLSEACRDAGIRFGIYFSILDWHHPELSKVDGGDGAVSSKDPLVTSYVHDVFEPQLQELVLQYHPEILWFDGEWVPWWTEEYGREVVKILRTLSPGIIINNRVGKRTTADGDYDTPEQVIPSTPTKGRLWEAAMTLNDTWGYKSLDRNWKLPPVVLSNLLDVVSKGGNLLLNVGPDGYGEIPADSVNILKEVGQWLNLNGDAIYGVTSTAMPKVDWGKLTRKANSLYAIIYRPPSSGSSLHLPISGEVAEAHLLVDGKSVHFAPSEYGIDLTLPVVNLTLPYVVKINFIDQIRIKVLPEAEISFRDR